jgi:hypothetical protein
MVANWIRLVFGYSTDPMIQTFNPDSNVGGLVHFDERGFTNGLHLADK